jgi:hypothetical protein
MGEINDVHVRPVPAGTTPPPLFRVRIATWRWVFLLVVAIVMVPISLLLAIGGLVTIDEDPAMLVVGLVLVLVGAGIVVLCIGLARTSIDVHPEVLVVRNGFRKPREVHPSAITEIRFWAAGRYPGTQGRNSKGQDLFHVANVAKHYLEFADWLAVNAPAAWAGYLQTVRR